MMPFTEKLSFLMHISDISNKELAAAISVDPSMISLMRTGKRKLPGDPEKTAKMAACFAQRCSAPFQRQALSEVLGLSSISPSMPVSALVECLERWLLGKEDAADLLLSGIQTLPNQLENIPSSLSFSNPAPASSRDSFFFYGDAGRREVMSRIMEELLTMEKPGPILFVIDDNLEWLLSDYAFTRQVQSALMELAERGFVFWQVTPPINYIDRYAESLQFWLPVYATGQVKAYYYPRIRDNLFRHSIIIIPGRCAQYVSTVNLGSPNDITLFTKDPVLIAAFEKQFEEYISLCRPSLIVHQDFGALLPLLQEFFSSPCETVQMSNTLPAVTMPKELLNTCIQEEDVPAWKQSFTTCLEHLDQFEEHLKQERHIDMSRLATVSEILSGKVCIASPHAMHANHSRYTLKTYALHLQNILRLMDEYDNYFFIPLNDKDVPDYDIYITEDGLTLITRTVPPLFTLEIRRQTMSAAFREHLLRKADAAGYSGTYKEKIRMELKALIQELHNASQADS